jgi:hypothetical protein
VGWVCGVAAKNPVWADAHLLGRTSSIALFSAIHFEKIEFFFADEYIF